MSRQNIKQSTLAGIIGLFSVAVLALAVAGPVQASKPSNGNNLVATAVAANEQTGNFDTLISAVTNLGLGEVLSGNKPYTVFAPTDAAFAQLELYPSSFENLSEADKATYTNIVLYHVTNGKRLSQSVVGDKQVRMINGDFAKVNGATIDGANIISADIKASNGVIHVVDKVLLP